MRYISKYIQNDLEEKMVLMSGPRQTGKTTLAKHIVQNKKGEYYNWDIRKDQQIIRQMEWLKETPIVVFDELHKYMKWKNFLKGVYDEFRHTQSFLVTGSARLETFRHEGDALTGRFFHYRLHPFDLSEIKALQPEENINAILKNLLNTGGFPESYYNSKNSERLRNNRLDLVIQDDLRDISKISSIRGISLLIELLRERVGSTANYQNLSKDLSVAPATVKSWIELLEQLYIIFLVPPYSKNLSRSIRKEQKVYFYDCSSAYNGDGAILENLVASSLIKYCHFIKDTTGKQIQLYYYRDREKREVDFIVEENRNIKWLIEIKLSDDTLNKNLLYLKEKINSQHNFQLVKNLHREKEIKGVKILNLCKWLNKYIKY